MGGRWDYGVWMMLMCVVVERYLEQLKHAKIKGYLFQQQNYFEGREGS
jgi:hypothetical protein